MKQRYKQMVQEAVPKPKFLQSMWRAFWVGGTICLIGQGVFTLFMAIEPTKSETAAATIAGMVFIGALLTAFGVYDDIGEYAGMGAAIPITGYSNSVVASAMDFRREGFIYGLGAKTFTIAGPVIVFGIVSGFFVALLKLAVMALVAAGKGA